MTSFADQAGKIRNDLKRYKKDSVINQIVEHLNAPTSSSLDELRKMPWISFLLIEWLYQVDEEKSAKGATIKDVIKIMNKIYALQAPALRLYDGVQAMLAIRKLLIGQLWVQSHPLQYQFFLIRMYALLGESAPSKAFDETFRNETDMGIKDFFAISLWTTIAFTKERHAIKYEDIIHNLHPHYSVDTLVKYFRLIGAGRSRLAETMMETKDGNISAESYFSDTKLLKMPILFYTERMVSIYNALLVRSLSEFALETLKKKDIDRFRRIFSPAFENYVEIAIKETGFTYFNEAEIQDIYKENNKTAKSVDFIIKEDACTIFIDTKAIEPHQKVKVSDKPRVLMGKLESSFSKGVVQAFETAKTLLSCNKHRIRIEDKRFALVVTNKDFYISNGIKLHEQISDEFFTKLAAEHGNNIPIENVYFICIEDFEGLLLLCKNNTVSLGEFLDFCVAQDSNPLTAKFDVRQHINAFAKQIVAKNEGPIGTNRLLDAKEHLFDLLITANEESNSYWRKGGMALIPEFVNKTELLKTGLFRP